MHCNVVHLELRQHKRCLTTFHTKSAIVFIWALSFSLISSTRERQLRRRMSASRVRTLCLLKVKTAFNPLSYGLTVSCTYHRHHYTPWLMIRLCLLERCRLFFANNVIGFISWRASCKWKSSQRLSPWDTNLWSRMQTVDTLVAGNNAHD